MDGKGRAIDNVFIERLWRSVKYEYIYPNQPSDGHELHRGLKPWFDDYNTARRHKSLNGEVPAMVYTANLRLRWPHEQTYFPQIAVLSLGSSSPDWYKSRSTRRHTYNQYLNNRIR
ncbi:MAG: transposase [Chlorobaculum sp.]|nr:transposase [Chlorobaculum sp.]